MSWTHHHTAPRTWRAPANDNSCTEPACLEAPADTRDSIRAAPALRASACPNENVEKEPTPVALAPDASLLDPVATQAMSDDPHLADCRTAAALKPRDPHGPFTTGKLFLLNPLPNSYRATGRFVETLGNPKHIRGIERH